MSRAEVQAAEVGPKLSLLAVAVAALAVFWLLARHFGFLCDDAYISFRYAENLVAGRGLVFNPGERVEGYTNFLWVLELAAASALAGAAPERTALALSGVFTGLTFGVVVFLALRGRPGWTGAVTAAITLVFLATNRSFAVWTTGGLETRQFTGLVLLGVALLTCWEQRRVFATWASLAFALAALTRPEGLLVWACAAAWLALEALRRHGRAEIRAVAAPLLGFAVPFGCIVLAHFLWRYAYYGEWLPNTYYAKHVAPWAYAGAQYLLTAGLEHGLYLVLPVAALGTFWRWRQFGDARNGLAWLLVLPHAAYLVRIGGDHFEYRPLDFYWPLLYLAFADGIVAIGSARAAAAPGGRARWLRAGMAGAVALLALAYGVAIPWLDHVAIADLETREETFKLHEPLRQAHGPALFHLPLLRPLVRRYNRARAFCAKRFIGTRQREHDVFQRDRLASWGPYGALAALPLSSVPANLVTSMKTIGVSSYFLPALVVIDEFGLTDHTIARAGIAQTRTRKLAHDRRPPPGYLAERGVNVEVRPAAATVGEALQLAPYAVQLAPGLWMPFDVPATGRPVFDRPVYTLRAPGEVPRRREPAFEAGGELRDAREALASPRVVD